MNVSLIAHYKSNSQIIRVLSENWFENEMFCPCCLNSKITAHENNQKVSDFFCTTCSNEFQLKSSKSRFAHKVLDGAYDTMHCAIVNGQSPNFFLLHYSISDWHVKNLFLIPKFFMNSSIIEKRKPLSKNARRAGWTGCNILLDRLPVEGRIAIVRDEKVIPCEIVNKNWRKMFFLNTKKSDGKSWLVDVLKCVNDLNEHSFSLTQLYKYKDYLKDLHPKNSHVEEKIRQQLQILRDNKVLLFRSRGIYELTQ